MHLQPPVRFNSISIRRHFVALLGNHNMKGLYVSHLPSSMICGILLKPVTTMQAMLNKNSVPSLVIVLTLPLVFATNVKPPC